MPPIQLSESEEKSIRQLSDAIAMCLRAFRVAELARQERKSVAHPQMPGPNSWDIQEEHDEKDPWNLKPKRLRVSKLLLNIREAAAMLSISTRTLHNLSAPRGPIPVVKLTSCVLYALPDLQAAIEQNKIRRRENNPPSSQP